MKTIVSLAFMIASISLATPTLAQAMRVQTIPATTHPKATPAPRATAAPKVVSSPTAKPAPPASPKAPAKASSKSKPFVEGKRARSPKGQLIAFVRVPDHGATELWVQHTKDRSTTLLRRGWLGIPTTNVRNIRIRWEGKLIRLESKGRVSYFDLRGRQVRPS